MLLAARYLLIAAIYRDKRGQIARSKKQLYPKLN